MLPHYLVKHRVSEECSVRIKPLDGFLRPALRHFASLKARTTPSYPPCNYRAIIIAADETHNNATARIPSTIIRLVRGSAC